MNCAKPHQANDVNMYLRFLMTGGTASVPVNQCKAWLSDTSWAEICRLSTLSAALSEKGGVGNNNANNGKAKPSVVGSDKLKFLKMKQDLGFGPLVVQLLSLSILDFRIFLFRFRHNESA